MNIKLRPFLIAGGLGLAVQIVILIISTLVTMAMMRDFAARMQSGALEPFGPLFGVIGLLVCLCGIMTDMSVGGLYAWFHNQRQPVEVADGAIGGGVTAAGVRVIASLAGILASTLTTPAMMGPMFDGSEMPAEIMAPALIMGVVGGVVGVCIWLFVGGFLGAAGGAIAAALIDRE